MHVPLEMLERLRSAQSKLRMLRREDLPFKGHSGWLKLTLTDIAYAALIEGLRVLSERSGLDL